MVYLSYPAKIMYIITAELPKQSPKLLLPTLRVRDPNSSEEKENHCPGRLEQKPKKRSFKKPKIIINMRVLVTRDDLKKLNSNEILLSQNN